MLKEAAECYRQAVAFNATMPKVSPSRFNSDHKWSFTFCEPASTMPRSSNVLDLAREFSGALKLERLVLQKDFYRETVNGEMNQTLTPVAECAIEMIWFKRA